MKIAINDLLFRLTSLVGSRFKGSQRYTGSLWSTCLASITGFIIVSLMPGSALAQFGPGADGETGAIYVGAITGISIDNEADHWSGGTMTLEGGHTITIPGNLVMALPANWMTLQQFCADAPAEEILTGCGVDHVALILANRQGDGTVIAGDVFIHKDEQEIQGIVTQINDADGSFRINGDGTGTGGTLVRLNDPDGVHSVQSGPECAGSQSNCSADPRYTNDPTNYTFASTTAYPMCINGSNCNPNSDRAGGASAQAADPLRFEPLLVGDWVSSTGNVETIGGVTFQSAHTILVGGAISTDPNSPVDYVTVAEAEWDTAGWANQRLFGLNIGMISSPDHVSVYRLSHNGATDAAAASRTNLLGETVDTTIDADGNLWQFIAGTEPCDQLGGAGSCSGQRLFAVAAGDVVKMKYDWDFLVGGGSGTQNPAGIVRIAGDPSGLLDASTRTPGAPPNQIEADNAFLVFAPIAREIAYATAKYDAARASGTETDAAHTVLDAQGNAAQWGFYISPNGIGFPEWEEIDLTAANTPFGFEAQLWNLDRRLGVTGGTETIEATPLGDASMALTPFPNSGYAPCGMIAAGAGFAPSNCETIVRTDPITGTLLDLPAAAIRQPNPEAPLVVGEVAGDGVAVVTPAPGVPVPDVPVAVAGVPVAPNALTLTDLQAATNAAFGAGLSVGFSNASTATRARLDITIADVPLRFFQPLPAAFAVGETVGCGGPGDLSFVCVGDEVAVGGFSATFLDDQGAIIRTFGVDNAQVVAQELFDAAGGPITDAAGVPQASQTVAWVLFSIRDTAAGNDVSAPNLVPGASTVEVRLGGVLLASATLTGDASLNNAAGVTVTSVIDGGLTAVDEALAAAAVPAPPPPVAAPPVAVTPPAVDPAPPVVAAGPDGTGTVDGRGRVRFAGTCPTAGTSAVPSDGALSCRTRNNGSFRCKGRNLPANTEVTATCE